MGFPTAVSILLFAACISSGLPAGKNYAVLIQGSHTWFNYAMAASVCHAYQTLRKAGMPEENIIVMMFDDIAYNIQNPYPGKIYNSPNGREVYHGVKIDYRRGEVYNDTFLAVLRGDQETIVKLLGRKGKVLESGPDDNVFVYYTGHGARGLVTMPTGNPLFATDLNDTLTEMYAKKRYANLVFYMGACYSGSMFYKVLSPDIKVYAVTGAPPDKKGWMMYCNSPKLQSCFGLEFECNWLGDTDFHDVKKRTFDIQFQEIKKEMNGSVPQHYGDMLIDKDVLAQFFGKRQVGETGQMLQFSEEIPAQNKPHCEHPDNGQQFSRVPISMAKLYNIKARLSNAPAKSKLQQDIEEELAAYEKLLEDTKTLFLDISRPFNGAMSNQERTSKMFDVDGEIKNWGCYKDAVSTLLDICPQVDINSNGASAEMTVTLAHLCNNYKQKEVLESVRSSALSSSACRPLKFLE